MDLADVIEKLNDIVEQGKLKTEQRYAMYSAINRLTDLATYPEKSQNAIYGEQPYLGWLMIMAFRYGVGRHGTQCLKDVFSLFQNNIHLMNDGFIVQMLEEIEWEFEYHKDAKEDGKAFDMSSPEYLRPFYYFLHKEYAKRLKAKGLKPEEWEMRRRVD